MSAEPAPAPRVRPPTIRGIWVNTTYFAEGLPYMVVRRLASVFYTDVGAPLVSIGELNYLGLPWNFKFLWAPLLDLVGTRRGWLVALQGLVGLVILGLAGLAWTTGAGASLTPFFVGLCVLAFLAASNDVAIDAYYMEAIPDRREQAAYSGFRVLSYRIAVVFATFGLVRLAAAPLEKSLAWALSFGAAGVTMLALSMFHALALPAAEAGRPPAGDVLGGFLRAFSSYLRQERAGLMLLFIATYKIGDEILFSMNTPFLMRELGVTKSQLSWLAGIVGAATTVAGAMLGAWWIKRTGLRRAIWPLTLLMNLNIWAYVWLAYAKPSPMDPWGMAIIALVHGYEQVAAALGNAVLLVYLLGTCRPEYKAAHYAVGSAIMSVPGVFIGGRGGQLVAALGYPHFFIAAFLATLPAMLLLFWVPMHEEPLK